MIKIITLITKFILIALTALLFASCNSKLGNKSIIGSGNITIEKRTVESDFKSIEVSNAIDVEIEQSDKIEIIVEADDNLQKEITTEVENGILVIACDCNSFINAGSKKVTVRMPIIEELEASSSATIRSIRTLKGENISLNTSSAAEITATIESDVITCDSGSGSTINLEGKALKLETSASSGSEIDARNLLANDIIASASSGGSIAVHPIVNLKAEAKSGGDIVYDIIPKSIEKQTNSGGSISHEE